MPFKPHFKVFFTPGKRKIAFFLHFYKLANFRANSDFKAKHLLKCMSCAAQETLDAKYMTKFHLE